MEEAGRIRALSGDTEVAPGITMIHTPAHTRGGMSVLVDTAEGRAAITGFCVIRENFEPPREVRAMEMEVIPPGTHVDAYAAYDIMVRLRDMADIIIPLHEPHFAGVDTV